MFAFLPNLGAIELLVIVFFLLFVAAAVVGIGFVISVLVKSPGGGANATLAEENRRLRDEVARLKGEKSSHGVAL